ncbi:MAG: TAT-variant-translocated molybdopterin oxidoreductase [Acidobacteria bacterium]|nr:TAT-variant-translocated molybdopterin oxidoreductase [Acidobacteriota bacterium]
MSEHHDRDHSPQQTAPMSGGRQEYWRSLEELADTEEFQHWLHREFPEQASEFTDPVGRRQFLRLMGASLALAGVTACTKQPAEAIVPYVRPPENFVPGKPLFFATAVTLGGVATGVLVESHEGRPTKIEGSPEHPASLGATDLFAQASILSLYDPDRSQTLSYRGDIRTWSAFLGAVRSALESVRAARGKGLRILTETCTSLTLARQLQALLAEFPAARWHQYEPAGRDEVRAGARLAFGSAVDTRYVVDKARVIVSLDADFLGVMPGSVRYTRDFSAVRRVRGGHVEMNRLYAVESAPTNTGAKADHRLAAKPSAMITIARTLAAAIGVIGVTPMMLPAESQRFVEAAARDLAANKTASLVVAGDEQPAAVHVLAHAINQALGNVGQTVLYSDSIEANPIDQMASLRELIADMQAGAVSGLLILGGNPVYSAPADLKFGEALQRVAFSAHLSLYEDETSAACQWHIPETHPLEAWSDARAWDGTVTILQPLISPLYGGKSAHDVVAGLSASPGRGGYDQVRDTWELFADQAGIVDFEAFWRKSVHDGTVAGTTLAPKLVTLGDVAKTIGSQPSTSAGLELVFRPDPTVYDGRFANSGWLQELPKPFSKITWDNTVQLSPATAASLGMGNEDVVDVTANGRTVRGPVWVVPGQADGVVTVHLGYGRTHAGRVGNRVGFNAYQLRTSDAAWASIGVTLARTGGRYAVASTQLHHDMAGRPLIRSASLEEFRNNPDVVKAEEPEPPATLTLYPEHEYKGYAWGLAIDINSCTGCNACVVACQSENNVPVVGKEQVAKGREMQWIRVDTYYKGHPDANPEAYHQPVMCQQCENAPCEVVCPVGATLHSDEGLNDMVYNRCVGTRYCSNNCPYKVRRFNFLLYQDWDTPTLKMQRNPDVSVRSRGVMEKCTYCVQRITRAKIDSEKEDRKVRDGEIVTACEQVCPAQAIVFGNINDPESRVAKLRAESLSYSLLGELNTRPRTTYLAALKNPNPAFGIRDTDETSSKKSVAKRRKRERIPAP